MFVGLVVRVMEVFSQYGIMFVGLVVKSNGSVRLAPTAR